MKLSKRMQYRSFDAFGFYKGRYKNFEVSITEGGDAWKRIHQYFYVSFNSGKYDKRYNSLWDNEKFETIAEAKEYAMNWVDAYIKENKK
ncbi:TPA: hypothetical protein ACGW65_000954 [Bacillus paranthracis]